MPLAQTVNGLIYQEALAGIGNWQSLEFANLSIATYAGEYPSAGLETTAEGVNNFGAYEAMVYTGAGSTRRMRLWTNQSSASAVRFVVGSWTATPTVTSVPVSSAGFYLFDAGAIDPSQVGYQTVQFYNTGASGSPVYANLVICASNTLTLTGLQAGWTVLVYAATTNTLISNQTVTAGTTQITVDLTNQPFPALIYLQILSGTTLVENTPSYMMCGGDTWNWMPAAPGLTATPSPFIIYQKNGTGSPKKSVITATLQTPNGLPYANKPVYFSTTLGTLSASSAITNSQGQASITLQAPSTFGIAVVTCTWKGDLIVPAATAYMTIHVFYGAETGNSNIPYQVYVEGYPLTLSPPATGTYTFNYRMLAGQFQITIPVWDPSITANGLVGIWRNGVKEYTGVVQRIERQLGDQLTVTLTGVDAGILLNNRVIDFESLTGLTPQAAIAYLLAKYWCGITAGSLATFTGVNLVNIPPGNYPSETSTILTDLTITSQTLQAAIQTICNNIGWVYRVNPNLTLDFAEAFGRGVRQVAFVEKQNIITASTITDYSTDVVVLHVQGNEIQTVAYDWTALQEIGLLEGTDLQPTISDLPTLNLAAQAALNNLQNAAVITITLEGYDGNPPSTFLPEDLVTVTSPTLGLSGTYTVAQITRDMAKPAAYCNLQLNGLLREFLLLDQKYWRIVHDLSVA